MKNIKIEDIDKIPEKTLTELFKYLLSNKIDFKIWDMVYIGE